MRNTTHCQKSKLSLQNCFQETLMGNGCYEQETADDRLSRLFTPSTSALKQTRKSYGPYTLNARYMCIKFQQISPSNSCFKSQISSKRLQELFCKKYALPCFCYHHSRISEGVFRDEQPRLPSIMRIFGYRLFGYM